MGVLTSSQFKAIDKNIGVVQGNSSVNKNRRLNTEAVNALKFPPAPMGEATATVRCDFDKSGKMVFKLKDGIFTLPKSWGKDRKAKVKKLLLDDGWEDASYIDGKPVTPPKPEKKYTYFAGHPENTDTSRVEGNVGVSVLGEDVQLECIDGVITTENQDIYTALLGAGFYEAKSAEEIKE